MSGDLGVAVAERHEFEHSHLSSGQDGDLAAALRSQRAPRWLRRASRVLDRAQGSAQVAVAGQRAGGAHRSRLDGGRRRRITDEQDHPRSGRAGGEPLDVSGDLRCWTVAVDKHDFSFSGGVSRIGYFATSNSMNTQCAQRCGERLGKQSAVVHHDDADCGCDPLGRDRCQDRPPLALCACLHEQGRVEASSGKSVSRNDLAEVNPEPYAPGVLVGAQLVTQRQILHVLTSNQRRGAEVAGVELAHELTGRGLAGRAVALAAGGSGTQLPVEVLGRTPLHHATLRRLRRHALSASVVVAHGSATLPACAVALWGTHVPFVYVNIGDLRYWAPNGRRRLQVRYAVRRAAAVTALSPLSARTMVERFGVPEDKITVIPNFRSAERFHPVEEAQRAAARAELGLPPSRTLAVMIGSLTPEKRVDLAIQAVGSLPDVHLAIAGGGPLEPELRLLAESRAPGRCTFLGVVQQPERVLEAADVLILASDSEGMPGVLIEAGLAGVPAVATAVGFVPDVVEDGVTGYLAAPGDAGSLRVGLRQAIARREGLGQAAHVRCVDRYETHRVVDRWERLLTSVGGWALA